VRTALINLAYGGSKVKSLPLGMALIAYFLSEGGHETTVLDAECDKLSIDQVYEWSQGHPADLVAINSTSYSRFDAADLARKLKASGVRWVLFGGHHYSHMPVEALDEYPFMDFVISGPAEKPLTELCTALEKEKLHERIEGLTFRQDGRIVSVPRKAPDGLRDPEKLPFELFDIHAYSTYDELLFLYNENHRLHVPAGRTATYYLSSGCPYDCYFCANVRYWKSTSFRALDNAIAEIAYLKEKCGITHFIMIDPSFTLNRAYTAEFCNRVIKEGLNIKFFCSTRVNLVDEALLDLLVQAGLQCIQFGIESGSQNVLEGICKGIEIDDVRNKVLMCIRKGLVVKGYFMFGHPNETEQDVIRTIHFAKDLYISSDGFFVPVSMFTDIYPGSRLEKIARENGRLNKDFNWFERKEYPQNEKIGMGWTMVPVYENEVCKIERVLELVYNEFSELLNKELFDGYHRTYKEKNFSTI
jgi:anaerobic magnesium-protoporphyrin IX monomethyl ester cyclase